MRHDGTSELFAYWNKLRGTRAAPERNEITPALIRSRLADTFIVQAVGTGEPRFRLAGTRICSIYGRELKGLPLALLWQATDRGSLTRLVKNCMTNKAVVHMNYEGKSARGRKALFDLVLLPLASEANERHLMGMIVALGRPFWLESDAIVENRIQSLVVSDPRHPTHRLSTEAIHTGSDSTNAMALSPTRTIVSRKVRHLRVFDGGKGTY